MSVTEEEEAEKSCITIPDHIITDRHRIIPRTNMPIGIADEIAQRFHDKEHEAGKKEECQRKFEVYNSHPKENLKIKKEIGEDIKEISEAKPASHQSSPITSSSRHQTPSPEKQTSTPSSQNRKKSLAKKTRKVKYVSWIQIGKRHVIKIDDDIRQTFKCMSDVMELPDSDRQKIVSLRIDRYNENDSDITLIEALKIKGFTIYERKKVVDDDPLEIIPIVSWELLRKMECF
ncbi:hypothetical protein L1987_06408 [Smallanthus sonchifolius]|uniref:Uncharacterized protein n=1 Tax=Smallanthus sonchifolius TaxID=185202 RepID=A0ACB9JY83_9ASTR|nr:hypothetical protein L1987_06408 [Smallanthus sonchifolius]